jgi:hypothetical protein
MCPRSRFRGLGFFFQTIHIPRSLYNPNMSRAASPEDEAVFCAPNF